MRTWFKFNYTHKQIENCTHLLFHPNHNNDVTNNHNIKLLAKLSKCFALTYNLCELFFLFRYDDDNDGVGIELSLSSCRRRKHI